MQRMECMHKVLVIGDVNVGKTALLHRYLHNTYSGNYKCTIGVDFYMAIYHINPTTKVRLQLWDIAGQDRHSLMSRVFYRNADAAFVVIDASNKGSSMEGAINWKREVDLKVANGEFETEIPCILLVNKCDLVDSINEAEMDDYCNANGFLCWIPTSAKDDIKVTDAIRTMGQALQSITTSTSLERNALRLLMEQEIEAKNKKKCCLHS